jgi:hypothetical protein
MKKMKLASLITLVFLITYHVHAQDYAFKVLVNKGKNEVKTGNSWQQVKVGAALKSADELKVSENSYVGLVHANGKPLEIKQAGKYKVTDLAAKIGTGSTVLNKYTDFILSANTTNKNQMTATGAVHRGSGEEHTLHLPEKPVVYNSEIIIDWDTVNFKGPYTITFRTLFEDELFKTTVKENFYRIHLDDKVLANEDNIVVKVTAQGPNKQSNEYTLKRLSKADRERIKNQLNDINKQMAEPSALSKLILAGFFEQNNLLADAASSYLEAIQLAPDVPAFKEDYDNFLIRTGIKRPEKK